ncbi:MAG: hypothetical protein H5T74_01015 [Actinobacteria bacterium]|nr:hypothetical protein [Actinomycetota bacterium]
MPGLMGFVAGGMPHDARMAVLRRMQEMLTRRDYHVRDELTLVDDICATRTYVSVMRKETQPAVGNDLYVWMEGEIFRRSAHGAGESDLEHMLASLNRREGFSFLKNLNGVFSAVVYDSELKRIHLITDRYGLRFLFWTMHEGRLAWASEAKAMLALPGFVPKIDLVAVREFMELGYLLGDRTWFEGVSLVPPGSVLTYDIGTRSLEISRYWWWDEIKPVSGRVDEREMAEEMGRLLVEAVEARSKDGESVGITLSGGLDSRAIIAAVPRPGADIAAVTFGIPDSPDVRIARRVARLRGARHSIVEIGPHDWLQLRPEAVWWTDGQVELCQLHGMEALDEMRRCACTFLNGMNGGAILGAGYLLHESYLDNMDRALIAATLGCSESCLSNFSLYEGLGKPDFYILENTTRRKTNEGIRMSGNAVECRVPFFDNALLEFAYSLPDALRYRRNIYRKALLRRFPEYFRTIPWSRTGVPVSIPPKAISVYQRARRPWVFVLGHLAKAGVTAPKAHFYVDYAEWMRKEPALSCFRALLLSKEPLYAAYVSADDVKKAIEEHVAGADNTEFLARCLTFELWLRQVYEGSYRDGAEHLSHPR